MGTSCSVCNCGRNDTESNTEVDFNDDQTTVSARLQGQRSSLTQEIMKQVSTHNGKITKIQAVWRGYHYRKLYSHIVRTFSKSHFSPDEAKEKITQDTTERETRPAYEFKTGARYTGEWKGGMRDGYGVQAWSDGARYEGNWLNNQAHGFGTFYHVDGDTYEGEWQQDKANGKGTYTQVSGALYEGEWKNDIQHGFGKEVWKDGSSYEGFYVFGKKQGLVIMCGLMGPGIWAAGETIRSMAKEFILGLMADSMWESG